MKALVVFLLVAVAALGVSGCGGKKEGDEKGDNEKGAVETTVDYFAGGTAIRAKSKAYQTTLAAAMKNAISMFEVENGRSPNSLQELVDAEYLAKTYLNDEYGRPLECESKGGKLIVRSVRTDKESGEKITNWKQSF